MFEPIDVQSAVTKAFDIRGEVNTFMCFASEEARSQIFNAAVVIYCAHLQAAATKQAADNTR